MNLRELAPTLEITPGGWWSPANLPGEISYPAEGNALCFMVEDSSFWFAHRNNCILEAMKRFPPDGAFVDIGGGNGYVARAIQEAGFEVVLVEPGIDGVRNAVKRGVTYVVHSTSDGAGILPGAVAGAGLFDVVEHIQEDRDFLKSVHHLLRPGGRVYITVPAYPWLWSHEDSSAGHARRYTLNTLRHVLEESGFALELETYIFGFLPPPIFLSRVIPYRLGFAHKPLTGDAVRSDHELRNPFARRILQFLTDREVRGIASGRSMSVGGTCLAVARKC